MKFEAGKQYYKQMTLREKQMHQEANKFACDLLMPEADFKWFIKNVSNDVNKISENFGVSPLAARVRASQLGLKTESK